MQAKSSQRMRLDEWLVANGHFETRSRARDAVMRGSISLAGSPVTKPGQTVDQDADISIDDPAQAYVSRAALKLIAGLDVFNIDPHGGVGLDVGASTGGFTQVLLERGAAHVVAIDVGRQVMDRRLRDDPRITVIEGLNARELTQDHLQGRAVDIVVCDVSFISITLALPPALELARPGAAGVFLVKPQFEVGREGIGKGGLLKNPDDGARVAEELRAWLDSQPGWRALGLAPSPIAGGSGNHEFLLGGVKDR